MVAVRAPAHDRAWRSPRCRPVRAPRQDELDRAAIQRRIADIVLPAQPLDDDDAADAPCRSASRPADRSSGAPCGSRPPAPAPGSRATPACWIRASSCAPAGRRRTSPGGRAARGTEAGTSRVRGRAERDSAAVAKLRALRVGREGRARHRESAAARARPSPAAPRTDRQHRRRAAGRRQREPTTSICTGGSSSPAAANSGA